MYALWQPGRLANAANQRYIDDGYRTRECEGVDVREKTNDDDFNRTLRMASLLLLRVVNCAVRSWPILRCERAA